MRKKHMWYGKNNRSMLDKETWKIVIDCDEMEKLIKYQMHVQYIKYPFEKEKLSRVAIKQSTVFFYEWWKLCIAKMMYNVIKQALANMLHFNIPRTSIFMHSVTATSIKNSAIFVTGVTGMVSITIIINEPFFRNLRQIFQLLLIIVLSEVNDLKVPASNLMRATFFLFYFYYLANEFN